MMGIYVSFLTSLLSPNTVILYGRHDVLYKDKVAMRPINLKHSTNATDTRNIMGSTIDSFVMIPDPKSR